MTAFYIRFVIFFHLIFCVHAQIIASHIVGGELTYQFIEKKGKAYNYKVSLFLYIDCYYGSSDAINSDKDQPISIFKKIIYPNKSVDYKLQEKVSLKNALKSIVRSSDNRICTKIPNLCIDKYTYTVEISLTDSNNSGSGYVLSYEACCRGGQVQNINAPGNTGATYWTTIPDLKAYPVNSSPAFNLLPVNFACINEYIGFNHNATDPDGDSLVYEFYTPFNAQNTGTKPTNPANYQIITWNGGYSMLEPLGNQSQLRLVRSTGSFTLKPALNGQFVIGIKVIEFRKGVIIGETKRDFHMTVSQCLPSVVANFSIPEFACTNNAVSYMNKSSGGADFFWDFGDPLKKGDTSKVKSPKYTFVRPGIYKAKLIVKAAQPSPCIDSFIREITILQNFKTTLPSDTVICDQFKMQLMPQPVGKQYLWSTGEKTTSINISKGGLYWVKVSDSLCYASDSIYITNDLSKVDLGEDSVICNSFFTPFVFKGPLGYKSYLWSDTTKNSSILVKATGAYSVSVVNANNCRSSDTIVFTLHPKPFISLKDTIFCRNTFVTLDGEDINPVTRNGTYYQWDNGDTFPQQITNLAGRHILTATNGLCRVNDTSDLSYVKTDLDLGNDTFYCGPFSRLIVPKQDYQVYLWQDMSMEKSYLMNKAGKVKLTITTKEGCIESDSISLIQYPAIDVGLNSDTSICLSSSTDLNAIDSALSYLWNTGDTGKTIRVYDGGLYVVHVKMKNGCLGADSIHVRKRGDVLPVEVFMPSAFTPNHDNVNEYYPGPAAAANLISGYQLSIYNRWGEKIFESSDPHLQWNGQVDDNLAPQGEYVFLINSKGCDDIDRLFRGIFTLLR